MKILIIGPRYYNYLDAAAAAFGKLGHEVVVEPYDNPIHPYTPMMKVRYKLSRHKERLQERSRTLFNAFILKRFGETGPGLVFILNGEILYEETLDKFRESAKVGIWFFDNREKLPLATGHIDHADALFCFENDDVQWYARQGKKAYFLPQACDCGIYRPLGLEKDIDIVFVGTLYTSRKRRRTTEALCRRFPELKIEVYGLYRPWYKGLLKCLTRPRKDVFLNRNVNAAQANELYNRARIALNIHQEFQKDGANPRVFEICGSGAYQICDRNPYVESLFPDGEIGLYSTEEELFSLVEKALRENTAERAEAARNMVLSRHSYEVRMKTVLEKLGF